MTRVPHRRDWVVLLGLTLVVASYAAEVAPSLSPSAPESVEYGHFPALSTDALPSPIAGEQFLGVESVPPQRDWKQIWGRASLERKNELLRSAGLKVFIERIALPMNKARRHNTGAKVRQQTKPPFCRVVRIEAEVPEFALALASGLTCEDSPHNTSVESQMPTSSLYRLPTPYRSVLRAALNPVDSLAA